MTSEARPFRILSLDGGGTWALIQVKALQALYGLTAKGFEVLRHFDLAVSNSGGSIVLGMLATNHGLDDALDLVHDERKREQMFSPTALGFIDRRTGIGPRYSAPEKLVALRSAYGSPGDANLKTWRLKNAAGAEVRMVICGFDYDRLREVFFRSHPAPPDNDPEFGESPTQVAVVDATIAEAVHASSNAPVNYFNEPATFGKAKARFWDGAMGGYNNPVLAGVVEAMGIPGVDRSRIRVLSIGTGSVVLPQDGDAAYPCLVRARRDGGFINDAKAAATCVLDDPPDAASFMAHVMLHGGGPSAKTPAEDGRLVRMSPLVQPVRSTDGKRWELPNGLNEGQFEDLVDLDMDAVKREQVKLIDALADSWIGGADGCVRNQPIRASRWLDVEIGHGTFAEARAAWEKLA